MTSRSENLVLIIRAKNQAKRVLKGAGDDLMGLDKKTQGFGQTALGVGKFATKAFLGIGVAVGGLAVAGVRSFAQFDDKMNQSLAIMGNVGPEMRAEMSTTAREIAKTTRLGANEAAESYFFLASAGLNAEQSIAALPQVAAFAQAGMFDMARATDLATDAQSALGLTVDDSQQNLNNLTRVTDVLVKANTLANASVEQFSTALTNKAGAALKVVNKDIEEGVAVLAAFADQGVKGELAGNALSIVMRDLQTQAIKNKDEFKAMNVEVFDSEGKMANMGEIVEDLEVSLEGMSDEQKKATLAQLGFNDRSVSFIQTLLGSSEAIKNYESELRNAGGTTQEIADNQMKSLSAQFDLVKSAAQDMFINLGEKLGPTIQEELVPAIMDLISSTGMFLEKIGPTMIKGITTLIDALTGVQMIVLNTIGIFDDDARRKAKQIVLNRQLTKGLGENMDASKRLAAAMITLGKENAWTEEGLRTLIATTGASREEVRAAKVMVREYADEAGYAQEFITMLDDATSDAQFTQSEWNQHVNSGAEELTRYQGDLEDTATEYDELEAETQEAIDAQKEYTDAVKAATDPVFGAVDALGKLQEAQAKVDELQDDGKEGTREWELAMLDLAEQTIETQGALDNVNEDELAAAIGAIRDITGLSDEAVGDLLTSLGLLDGTEVAVALKVTAPDVTYTVRQTTSGATVTSSSGSTRTYYAQGGLFYRGENLVVGEEGLEFITATQSGKVVSNPGTEGGNFAEFMDAVGFGVRTSQPAMSKARAKEVHVHLHGVDLTEGSRKTLLKIREGLRELDLETA